MASCEKNKNIEEKDGTVVSVDETVLESSLEKIECAVCLQTCIQPVRLPCGHIFCYLCVKGVTHQSKRCAMCRQEIPASYLDNPSVISAQLPSVAFEGSYQWFYEGRNGWWQYDERTSLEIETAYKRGDKQCEVLIAGFLYKIDLESNVQVRRCDPSRRRKIKRDHISITKKGVAGIRQPSDPVSPDESRIAIQSHTLNDSCCSHSSNTSSGSITDFNSSCIDSSSSEQ